MQKWLMGGLAASLLGCGPGVSTSEFEPQLVDANRRIEQLESRLNSEDARTSREFDRTALLVQRLDVLESKTVALSREEVEGHPARGITGGNVRRCNGGGSA